MNYLAHALLSGDDPGELIGNMAADSLKGRLPSDLLPAVVRGVHLHREIDRYTDGSDEFAACKAVFESRYGRFAHVLVDIAFDHVLCKSWHLYCGQPFPSFVERVYAVFLDSNHMMPKAFIPIAERMRSEDWLTSYAILWRGSGQPTNGWGVASASHRGIWREPPYWLRNDKIPSMTGSIRSSPKCWREQ